MRVPVADFKSSGGLRTIVEGVPDDLLLVSHSFEPRASFIVDSLAADYAATLGVVYFNEEVLRLRRREDESLGSDVMAHSLAAHAGEVKQARGSILNSGVQLSAFQSIFSHMDRDSVSTITVDATTFNRETLLILLGLLDTFFPGARTRIVYVSPETYGSWLSAGFQQVRNIIGLGGLQDPSKRTLLVVLYGYEYHRALKIIEEYEPSKVLLGFGGSPTEVDFLKRNLAELDKVKTLALSQQEVVQFDFPADSIATCAARLEEIITPFLREHNVVVAPMCTKLSTIASYVLAKKRPQLQVSYCVPGEYNSAEYSRGVKTVFMEELASA